MRCRPFRRTWARLLSQESKRLWITICTNIQRCRYGRASNGQTARTSRSTSTLFIEGTGNSRPRRGDPSRTSVSSASSARKRLIIAPGRNAECGNRVGIFRVLDVLDRHAIKASVAIGASACERYPALVAEVTRRGWEVLAHGTHATPDHLKQNDRRRAARLHRGIDGGRREAQPGSAPRGWLSQDQGEAPNTPALLADAGIHYLVDWSNDDQAYLMEPGLVSIPHQIEWDDILLFWLRRVETWRYPDLIEEAARTLVEEGMISGRNFGLSIHPWLFGMAHRIRFLDEALTRLRAIDGLWQATTGEIATWARGQLEARK